VRWPCPRPSLTSVGRGGRDKAAEQAKRDFIKGKTNKVRLGAPLRQALGYSPTLATASGAGTHGGSKRQRRRRNRAQAKAKLRRGEWD